MIKTLPCKRIFDEKIVAICSKYPCGFADLLKKYNIHTSYVVDIKGMKEIPKHPVLLENMIINNYRDIKVFLDESDSDINRMKDLLKKEKIEFVEIENLKLSTPNIARECTSENLYISMMGDVYQCPKMIDREPITNIKNDACIEELKRFIPGECSCKRGYIIKATDPLYVKRVSIEFGGICNAKCVYCYQTYNKERKDITFSFYQLDSFLDAINFDEIVVAGGEVMCQNETLAYIEKLKKRKHNIKISLKTNGFSGKYKKAMDLFDDILVSINCFSESNLRLIMGKGIQLSSMIEFCEKISREKKSKISIKYLLTPISIVDVPRFLKWALELEFEEIAFTKAMLFGEDTVNTWEGSSFYNLNNIYWEPIFERNRECIKDVLDNINKDENGPRLRMEQGTKELLGL